MRTGLIQSRTSLLGSINDMRSVYLSSLVQRVVLEKPIPHRLVKVSGFSFGTWKLLSFSLHIIWSVSKK